MIYEYFHSDGYDEAENPKTPYPDFGRQRSVRKAPLHGSVTQALSGV